MNSILQEGTEDLGRKLRDWAIKNVVWDQLVFWAIDEKFVRSPLESVMELTRKLNKDV